MTPGEAIDGHADFWTVLSAIPDAGTVKALKPFLATAIPEVDEKKMLHYGGLRGVNTLKECEFVALVGSMHPPDNELAWFAATLYAADLTPPSMLTKTGRKAVAVKSKEGDYDVYGRDFGDPRLNLAAQLTTVAEMIQAIGRARPYEPRAKRQTVLIYSNMPLPMPVSLAATREEYLRSLNINPSGKALQGRVQEAMAKLKAAGEFGFSELSESMNVAESTLKQKTEYRDIIKAAMGALDLEFIRGGDGKAGVFRPRISDFTIVPKDYILGTAPNSKPNLINPLPSTTPYLDAVCDQVGMGLRAFFASRFKMAPAGIRKTVQTNFDVVEALTA